MTKPYSEGACTLDAVTPDSRPVRPYREAGLWALFLLVVLVYFGRLGERPVRHEEPHRGQVAAEMFVYDDFVVPREQGIPYLSRPPLQNWVIAGASQVFGHNALAIRLPSALSVLLMVLILYWYTRQFLGPLAAFAAGAAYCSMGQVLELGTKGETEALFTLWVSGSLLLWHMGAGRGRITWRTWALAYVFVALGTLTKGPQAPVYFAASVGGYMLWTRRWRELLAKEHAVGILCFVLITGAWLVPFWQRMGSDGVWQVFWGDVDVRFHGSTAWSRFLDTVRFPVKLIGSMMPWSILLCAYLFRSFRKRLGDGASMVKFLSIVVAVTLPTCWFVPSSTARYFMPLYPCVAALIAVVVQRVAQTETASWRWVWTGTQRLLAVLAGITAVALPVVCTIGPSVEHRYAYALEQPVLLVLGCSLATGVCAALLWWSSCRFGARAAYTTMVATFVFEGVVFTAFLTNVYLVTASPTRLQVEALREELPDGTKLVSLGWVDPVFVHYLGEPVPCVGTTNGLYDPFALSHDLLPEVDYFVWSPGFAGGTKDALGFEWDLIAVITCDFTNKVVPEHPVYVGRVRR